MTFFLGTKGNVRLKRGSSNPLANLDDQIVPDDINLTLNRLSFDKALDNILTGDRVDIFTTDPRGLICFPAATWSDGLVNNGISAYVHVNAAGGLRFFDSFQNAVNNNRANELPLAAFAGDPLPIVVRIRDVSYNILGCVQSYEFSTDRDTIDTTTLNDKFRQQFSAGLISGSGRIECAFDYQTSGVKEAPLLMLQLIQRVDVGSEFDLALYLTDQTVDPTVENIFYELQAMVVRSGVSVRAGDIIDCTIDFVTTGEVRLLVGKPGDYFLKEDNDRLELDQSLDFLLQEERD
jgi:hypothetical protein